MILRNWKCITYGANLSKWRNFYQLRHYRLRHFIRDQKTAYEEAWHTKHDEERCEQFPIKCHRGRVRETQRGDHAASIEQGVDIWPVVCAVALLKCEHVWQSIQRVDFVNFVNEIVKMTLWHNDEFYVFALIWMKSECMHRQLQVIMAKLTKTMMQHQWYLLTKSNSYCIQYVNYASLSEQPLLGISGQISVSGNPLSTSKYTFRAVECTCI